MRNGVNATIGPSPNKQILIHQQKIRNISYTVTFIYSYNTNVFILFSVLLDFGRRAIEIDPSHTSILYSMYLTQ